MAAIRGLREQIAAGRAPSPVEAAGFVGVIEAAIRATHPVLQACDQARAGGPFQISRLLDLARLVESALGDESEAAPSKKGGAR